MMVKGEAIPEILDMLVLLNFDNDRATLADGLWRMKRKQIDLLYRQLKKLRSE